MRLGYDDECSVGKDLEVGRRRYFLSISLEKLGETTK
jgi:hypothetical protein